MKLFLLISVLVSAANGGHLFWGDATEITDNGLFSLQCQHDGKFLTAGAGGVPTRQEWHGGPNQKFVFTRSKNNEELAWKLTPIDKRNAITDHYKITDVGHGKYQLKSFLSGKCFQARGPNTVVEGNCDNNDPTQRWFAAVATYSKI